LKVINLVVYVNSGTGTGTLAIIDKICCFLVLHDWYLYLLENSPTFCFIVTVKIQLQDGDFFLKADWSIFKLNLVVSHSWKVIG
jgi:hypothetical protein